MATEARRKAQAKYNAKPEQKKRRAQRNAARRKMIKAGKAKKGDGRDVMHKNGNPNDNRSTNLKMGSHKENRSYARTKTARKKNPRS